MFLTLSAFDTLYQFWIHTRVIGRLGPLEWVLNTPSHHRVHHACNPKYIDRNYGGHADRVGPDVRHVPGGAGRAGVRDHEAAAELEPGLGQPALWVDSLRKARRTARWPIASAAVPEPAGMAARGPGGFEPPPEVDRATYQKFLTPLPRGLASYVFAQFLLALLGATWLLFRQEAMGLPLRVACATMADARPGRGGRPHGAQRPWAFSLEWGAPAGPAAPGRAGDGKPGRRRPGGAGRAGVGALASRCAAGAAARVRNHRPRLARIAGPLNRPAGRTPVRGRSCPQPIVPKRPQRPPQS